MRAGVQPAVGAGQVLGEVMVERVAALLRREHEREGRIAGDVDRLERVHLHGDAEAGMASAPKVCTGGFVTLARRWEVAAASGRGR